MNPFAEKRGKTPISAWFSLTQAERDKRSERQRLWREEQLRKNPNYRDEHNRRARAWQAHHKDRLAPKHRARDRRDIELLADRYVRRVLKAQGVPASEITAARIIEKRAMLLTKRSLRRRPYFPHPNPEVSKVPMAETARLPPYPARGRHS